MNQRLWDWLHAQSVWPTTVVLFVVYVLLLAALPLSEDAKSGALKWGALALAVLHFFLARHELLLICLETLTMLAAYCMTYILGVTLFCYVCSALTGRAMTDTLFMIAGRLVAFAYCWEIQRILKKQCDSDMSIMKIFWLSWAITPFLARRLIARSIAWRFGWDREGDF